MKEPTQISWKELVSIFEDVRDLNSEQRFCFLLGAGASRSSDIPTGWELADKWYKSIKKRLTEKELKEWEESIDFDKERLGEFYTYIYERRFRASPETGYAEFKQLMDKKEPSIGYVILAQILANEKHNFVITTNFDYLVEDAVRMYTATKPFSAGHETLAAYITTQTERPTIIKVHRDLFLHPFNDKKGTELLKKEWREALMPVLRDFNLLVIGYGGNDGSLMDYLKEIDPDSRKPIYWCKREQDEVSEMVKALLTKKDFLVHIAGFDELMYALYDSLEYETFKGLDQPNDHPFYKNAKERVNDLYDKLKELLETSKGGDKARSEPSVIKSLFTGPLEYVYAAQDEKDLIKKEEIFKEGLTAYPLNADLRGFYASFLSEKKNDHDQAEIHYQKSLELDPRNAIHMGNYANFLCDVKIDHDQAEKYYKRSLDVDPNNGMTLGNYASFLQDIRKDYDQADLHYRKSLKAAPSSSTHLGNYALFLQNIKRDYERAEIKYKEALAADATDALNLSSYAWFLEEVKKDHDQADLFYKKSLEIDPNNADNLGNYAVFLQVVRKDLERAAEYYGKSIGEGSEYANFFGNYAGLLIQTKQEYGMASEYIARAIEQGSEDIDVLSELWFYRYAHFEEHREEAEKELKRLIKEGAKSIGWDLQSHVNLAKENGHPNPKLLQRFADQITKE